METFFREEFFMKRFFCIIFSLICMFSLVSCSLAPEPAEPGNTPFSPYPNEICPEIMVGGEIYYWEGESKRLYGTDEPYCTVYQMGDGKTFLPEGFSESGKISSVTDKTPTDEFQLKADFEAFGTVYASQTDTEAVYILMTSENLNWPKEQYIRFISAELLDGCHVALGGKLFRIQWGGNGERVYVDKLPENAVHIGNLDFIGIDKLPENDFETNCPNDSYSKAFTGRKVFQNPNDPDHIYVLSERYSSAGTFERYLKCPVIK